MTRRPGVPDDPLAVGVAYDATPPAARHERLCDFRVLLRDDHPLVATGVRRAGGRAPGGRRA
ncbi:hypothetical protein ACWERJ_13120, partial [Streptomyces sp. NPDC004050]